MVGAECDCWQPLSHAFHAHPVVLSPTIPHYPYSLLQLTHTRGRIIITVAALIQMLRGQGSDQKWSFRICGSSSMTPKYLNYFDLATLVVKGDKNKDLTGVRMEEAMQKNRLQK